MQLKNTQSIRTRYRDHFVCYVNDSIISDSLRMYGEYQQIELDFLLQFVKDRVVYDIGANIGTHSTGFASVASKVYSFEASPVHFQTLKSNTRDRDNVEIFNIAVSDHKGKIMIETFDTAVPGNYGSIKVGARGKSVPQSSLDDLELDPPALMKIDVEGHEWFVIKGAMRLIETHRPIIYFEAQELPNIGEIYPFLKSFDYEMVWCAIPNFNPDNFNGNHQNIFGNSGIFSVLCVPKGFVNLQGFKSVLGPADRWQDVNSR